MRDLKCLIIEDEPMAQKILTGYIADTPFLELVKVCDDAVQAMQIIHGPKEIDLIFLDIEIPKLKGFEFLKLLSKAPNTIVTTAYSEFAIEAFELNVIDYLLKPFSYERFLKAVNKLLLAGKNSKITNSSNHVFVKLSRKMVKLELENISFIEGLSNYIKIFHLGEIIVTYEGLGSFQKRISSEEFIRVHKSYLVNFSKISAFTNEYVEINGKHIPIGKKYRSSLMQKLKE